MKNKLLAFSLLFCCFSLLFSHSAQACTSWEVAGKSLDGAGTVIAKNRDYAYGEYNYIKIVSNGGYKFLALYANTGNKGGVNEKGLSVLSLSAPASVTDLPSTEDSNCQKLTITWLLKHCATVDEVVAALHSTKWNTHPEFLAIADTRKIAYVELGPDGTYAVRSTDNGTLAHTNHYVEDTMMQFNPENPGYESTRYQKAIEQLSSKDTISFDDVTAFSQDPVVWYKHKKIMTYASFVIHSKPDGNTTIWLKIANPDTTPWISTFELKDALSGKIKFNT